MQAQNRKCFSAYTASFVATGVLMPIFLSIITLILYFGPPISFLPHIVSEWYSLVYGLLSLLIIWPLASLCFVTFSTAQGVNPHSYGILCERYEKLHAKITCISHKEDFINSDNEKEAALEQARNQCARLQKILFDECSGIKWLTCYSYVTAWQLLHSAEEVFILVEPLSLTVSDAMHDLQIIQDSSLSNRQQLLKRLNIGIAKLSPHIESYLSPLDEAHKDTQQSFAPVASIGIKERGHFLTPQSSWVDR